MAYDLPTGKYYRCIPDVAGNLQYLEVLKSSIRDETRELLEKRTSRMMEGKK